MLYKFLLGKMPKTTSFGKTTINLIWKFMFRSNMVKEEVERRINKGKLIFSYFKEVICTK